MIHDKNYETCKFVKVMHGKLLTFYQFITRYGVVAEHTLYTSF